MVVCFGCSCSILVTAATCTVPFFLLFLSLSHTIATGLHSLVALPDLSLNSLRHSVMESHAMHNLQKVVVFMTNTPHFLSLSLLFLLLTPFCVWHFFNCQIFDRFRSRDSYSHAFLIGSTNHWCTLVGVKVHQHYELLYLDSRNMSILNKTEEELKKMVTDYYDEKARQV